MEVIELVDEMQSICEKLRQDGRRIRLIPTMGALHIGHASLIKAAAYDPPDLHLYGDGDGEVRLEEEEDVTGCDGINGSYFNVNIEEPGVKNQPPPVIIVSIFANPTQFDRASDFDLYPRTDEADLELCRNHLVDYVFMPNCQEIYPTFNEGRPDVSRLTTGCDYLHRCMIEPPTTLNDDLEGLSRKGHFRGMLTIVCKLFNIIRPHEAYFGEKDYQQMMIVRRMIKDLNMNICIRPVATVRDPDMLPLSSRNVRLNTGERAAAPLMFKILQDTKRMLESMNNNNNQTPIEHLNNLLLASLMTSIVLSTRDAYDLVHCDYLQLRCSKDFSKIEYQDEKLKFFDCQEACVRRRQAACLGTGRGSSLVLKTRLLISCMIGHRRSSGIRLLDNIEVKLNKNSVSS